MPSTGGAGSRGGGRGGQSEGRRATISSALELEGTVSHEGDLTNFITKNLEQKIKMSSKPSLDCSDCEYGMEQRHITLDVPLYSWKSDEEIFFNKNTATAKTMMYDDGI